MSSHFHLIELYIYYDLLRLNFTAPRKCRYTSSHEIYFVTTKMIQRRNPFIFYEVSRNVYRAIATHIIMRLPIIRG